MKQRQNHVNVEWNISIIVKTFETRRCLVCIFSLRLLLRLHHDSIFVWLPAINWQCCHIGGPHMVVRRLLSLVRRCGTHRQNVYVIPLLVLLFLAIFWKHSSFQRIRGFGDDVLYKSTFYITLQHLIPVLIQRSELQMCRIWIGSA